jgi:hypothetical protein
MVIIHLSGRYLLLKACCLDVPIRFDEVMVNDVDGNDAQPLSCHVYRNVSHPAACIQHCSPSNKVERIE